MFLIIKDSKLKRITSDIQDIFNLFILLGLHYTIVYICTSTHIILKMARKQLGLRLEPELIDRLKKESKRRNRSVTNLVETWIKEKIDLL